MDVQLDHSIDQHPLTLPLSTEEPTMPDPFPNQLEDAARTYLNTCTAFAQFCQDVGHIGLRIQAPEIMMEFVGEVQFGRDPKGLLFYHPKLHLGVREADYKVFYHSEASPLITVRVDFYVPGESVTFARFLAKVDTMKYTLPPESHETGQGNWKPFIIATCQTDILKVTCSPRVRLRFPPIRKQVIFNAEGRGNEKGIDTTGVLIFPDLQNLKTIIDPNTPCVVDYAPDRFVFHPEKMPEKVVALFLPDEPLDINPGDQSLPEATWDEYNPNQVG